MFEMGTGVPSPLLSPDFNPENYSSLHVLFSPETTGQAIDLLVSVSLIHYCTYTSDLSTWCLPRVLPLLEEILSCGGLRT